MSNDLEAEIRDALRDRAMTVTADDVGRRAEPPQAGRRSIFAPLAAAAAIAALAVGIAVAAWPSGPGDRQPSAAAVNFTGIDWRLVRGSVGTTTTFTTPNDRPRITFNRDGTFGADDGINYLGGKYRQTATGVVLSDVAATLVGYAGHDRSVIATATAFAALTGGRSPTDVQVNDRGELVLSGGGYMLWFRNAGAADTPTTAASPTSTGTATEAPASYINGSELPASGAS